MFRLDDKIAIVTGGYGYLGLAMCQGLSEMGAKVIAAGPSLEKYQKAFRESSNIFFEELDVLSDDSIKACFENVNKKYGKIDVLVNNAFAQKGGKPEDASREDWNYSVDGVLTSVNSCIKYIIPFLKKTQGKIINISSMYGMVSPDFSIYNEHPGYFNPAQYGASKAGVIQLTKYYANYLAAQNINVNCITPGPFPSKSVQQDIKFIDLLKAKVPLSRIGDPDDLKGPVVFLSSRASSFITGQNIIVDGGWTIS